MHVFILFWAKIWIRHGQIKFPNFNLILSRVFLTKNYLTSSFFLIFNQHKTKNKSRISSVDMENFLNKMLKPLLSMYTYTVYICMAICSLLCSCLNCEQRVVWREFFSLRAQWRVEPLFGWLGCCHTVGQIPPKFKEFSNLIDCYWCGLSYFSFVCLLKLILFNSKSQNQVCNWNQKCFCFVLQK